MYGLETWVMTPCIERVWGGCHHRVACSLTVRQPWSGSDGGWVYPPLVESMAEVVLHEVETYVSLRQNKVAHSIATSPIMYLFLEEE